MPILHVGHRIFAIARHFARELFFRGIDEGNARKWSLPFNVKIFFASEINKSTDATDITFRAPNLSRFVFVVEFIRVSKVLIDDL